MAATAENMGYLGKRKSKSVEFACCTLLCAFACVALSLFFSFEKAYADASHGDSPSVLLVDASVGDFDSFKGQWLAADAEEYQTDEGVVLYRSDNPLWWGTVSEGESEAPATYLLGCAQEGEHTAITSDDIIWALDQIAASGDQAKTVIVSVGCSGLQARLYAEDLASVKQSERSDIVGMVFLGVPQNGYSVQSEYPTLDIWNAVEASSGLTWEDLQPESDFLTNLNEGSFANVVKSFEVLGCPGDLGFGLTDGLCVGKDMELSADVCSQISQERMPIAASQNIGLSLSWLPYAKNANASQGKMDEQLAERLSAMDSYISSAEVKTKVKNFYLSWFADGSPVTRLSSVIALDLSGSMLESVDGVMKIDSAKSAISNYMQVVDSRSKASLAVPTDLTVYGFDTGIIFDTEGYGSDAQAKVDSIQTGGDTDIGLALQTSLNKLETSPLCADKRILLVSDGASTAGQSEEQILSGVVAKAASEGVAIDAIAFGDAFTQSDISFLQQVVDATGGTLYESSDEYGLKCDLLRTFYSSLGLSLVDTEFDPASDAPIELGSLDETALSFEVGVLTDDDSEASITVLKDGVELDSENLEIQVGDDGLTTVQVAQPSGGSYAVSLAEGSFSKAHVFGVGQFDKTNAVAGIQPSNDIASPLLIGFGVLMLVVLAVISIASVKKKND